MKKLPFLFLILAACSQDVMPVEQYPAEVTAYVIKFKSEATARGYHIDMKGLKIIIADSVPRKEFEAYYERDEHTVYFRKSGFNWNSTREEVVMHELGHAILKRDHRFDRFGGPTDAMVSVMGCPCDTPVSGWTNAGHQGREKYYYDELFNPQTPAPDWSK